MCVVADFMCGWLSANQEATGAEGRRGNRRGTFFAGFKDLERRRVAIVLIEALVKHLGRAGNIAVVVTRHSVRLLSAPPPSQGRLPVPSAVPESQRLRIESARCLQVMPGLPAPGLVPAHWRRCNNRRSSVCTPRCGVLFVLFAPRCHECEEVVPGWASAGWCDPGDT